jgi:hypothetical protein
MKNLVYFCPRINRPIGGIKVIHRHSEIVNSICGRSEIFYCQPYDDETVDWFKHEAVIRENDGFDPLNDFVIFPESTIFDAWKDLVTKGVDYGIFVQNGYLLSSNLKEEDLSGCYSNAKYIFCISDDAIRCVSQFFPECASKVVRLTYSVNEALFQPGKKENIITYMPRKMGYLGDLFIPLLRRIIPAHWSLVPIDKMSEFQVAEALSKSRIFLAFSGSEGLPVPPVEAALSGNFVIGYTGQGGREYWNPPVFEAIDSGDIVRFADTVLKRIGDIEKYSMEPNESHTIMLRDRFSREMEQRLIGRMIEIINS